jgi:glycosyltransferase involved in cell wall biosynthesis
VASARGIKLKNINLLRQAFSEANDQLLHTDLGVIDLDTDEASATLFKEKVRSSYAIILVSISEISPNMIFDAIRAGVPFIVTKENGIVERIRDCAIFVDPTSKEDIKEKIVWLSNPLHRQMQVEKIQKFNWVHTWEEIGNEIVKIYRT